MTALDWGIVAFTLALGIWGYRQGLIVGFLTLIGFAAGAFVGSRLAPLVLSEGAESPYAPLLAALGALLAGALVAVTLESMALGLRARLIRNRHHLHLADGAGGAALVACVALGIVWVFGAVALHAPGTANLRGDVQRSLIMRSLNELMPPSGPVLNALDRVDPAPSIIGPDDAGRPARRADRRRSGGAGRRRLGGPRAGHGLRARRRGLGLGGRPRPGRHQRARRRRRGRHDRDAPGTARPSTPRAVHYDTDNDLAILRISADLPPLPVAESAEPRPVRRRPRLPGQRALRRRPGALRRDRAT